MAFAEVTTVGNGTNDLVTVPWDYIEAADVHVSVGGVEVDPATFEWIGSSQIRLPSAPPNGALVRVYRETDASALTTVYSSPNVFDHKDLNRVLRQLLFVTQEAFDDGAIALAEVATIADTVDDGVDAVLAAVTVAQGHATSASGSDTAAGISAAAAAQSALDAQASVGGVKVTASDTTPGSLNTKLTVTAPLAKQVGTPGGNETLGLTISIASEAEAQAGIATDKLMTPERVAQAIEALVVGVPIGTTIYVNGTAAPTGFLKENGALVSRTTYADLWAYAQAAGRVVSEANWSATDWGAFGEGDGATTFRLPDSRGEFVRGLDDGRGVDSGRLLGAKQDDLLEAHTHTVAYTAGGGGPAGLDTTAAVNTTSAQTTTSTGGGETRPRNISKLACIKY